MGKLQYIEHDTDGYGCGANVKPFHQLQSLSPGAIPRTAGSAHTEGLKWEHLLMTTFPLRQKQTL